MEKHISVIIRICCTSLRCFCRTCVQSLGKNHYTSWNKGCASWETPLYYCAPWLTLALLRSTRNLFINFIRLQQCNWIESYLLWGTFVTKYWKCSAVLWWSFSKPCGRRLVTRSCIHAFEKHQIVRADSLLLSVLSCDQEVSVVFQIPWFWRDINSWFRISSMTLLCRPRVKRAWKNLQVIREMGQVQEVARQLHLRLLHPSSKHLHLHLQAQLHLRLQHLLLLTCRLIKFSTCQLCLQQWYAYGLLLPSEQRGDPLSYVVSIHFSCLGDLI